MKRTFTILLVSFLLASCNSRFEFSPYTVISVENDEQREVADWFAWHFAAPGGFVPMVFTKEASADVIVTYDSLLSDSHFRLDVGTRKIHIVASGSSGLYRAFQTLCNLLPEQINSARHADSVIWTVPTVELDTLSDLYDKNNR